MIECVILYSGDKMKVLIIGGGPAGLMCACKASETHDVILIEKNEKVGKKIYITGKGRCNVTNNCPPQEFINNVVTNNKFLYSSINRFTPQDVMNFFESNGVTLVTERGNRVFPYSYKASDITKALVNKCLENKVQIKLEEEVKSVELKEGKYLVKTNKLIYIVDKLVIATGGLSYPNTGSTGDGYKFAKGLDIKVTNLLPALVPLLIKDNIPKELYNFTFKNVQLSAFNKQNKKIIKQEFGELMTMKNALAGPIALTISSLINHLNPQDVALEIDFKPAINEEKLDARIKRDIEDLKKRANSNAFILVRGLVPNGLIQMILQRSGVDSNLKIKQITQEHISSIIYQLKHFAIDYLGLDDYSRAIVTKGGIDVKELNPQTMEVKSYPGLYFVGEVIDVDAFTGGFNMQIALSTGYSAGKHISEQ